MNDAPAKREDTLPIGMFLWGDAYLQAARIMRGYMDERWSHPVYFLDSQAIELFLKSYLRTQGFSEDELKTRKWRHGLTGLWEGCVAKGLPAYQKFGGNCCTCLIDMLDASIKEHEYRYLRTGSKSEPTIDSVDTVARGLRDVIFAVMPIPCR